jgi:hypothetical protein
MRKPDERRKTMFISIRKYRNVKSVDEVKHRVEQEFIPMLKQNPGFQGYYLIDCSCPESGNLITSITMFDNWASVLDSNDRAKRWVKERLADMLPEPVEAVGGEVILNAPKQRILTTTG